MKLKLYLVINFLVMFVSIANVSVAFARGLSFAEYAYQNIKLGNVEKVKSFIAKGYNIESVGYDGYSAVCYALAKNDKKSYAILRGLGASIKHPCIKKVANSEKLKEFNKEYVVYAKNNSKELVSTQDLRNEYKKEKQLRELAKNKKENSNNKYIWAGLLGVGGVAALASGGGGGGNSGGENNGNENNECEKGYHLVGNSCIPDEGESDNVEFVHDGFVQGGDVEVQNSTNEDIFAVYTTGNGVYNLYSVYAHPDDYASIKINNNGNGMVAALYGEGFARNAFVDGMRQENEINPLSEGVGNIVINNVGSGNVYGVYSKVRNANNSWDGTNSFGVDFGIAKGYIDITHTGKGKTYGVVGDDRAYNAYGGFNGSSLGNINIKSDGDIYGVSGYMGVFNATSHQLAPGKKIIGNIDIQSIGDGDIYGISVQKDVNQTDNNTKQWFVMNAAATGNDEVEGNINIHNIGNGNIYGIYGGVQMYNALNYGWMDYSKVKGVVNIVNEGNGKAYGMYIPEEDDNGIMGNLSYGSGGEKGSVQSVINIVNAGDGVATGMRGASGVEITNSGEIYINNIGEGTAVGIYGEKYSDIINAGTIKIYRQEYYDKVNNINLIPENENGGTAFGIYAQKGTKVRNSGDIIIENAKGGAGIYLEDGASLENSGNVIFNGSEGDVLTGDAIDIYGVTNTIFGNLNDFGKGEVILAKGGKFFADKLSGDMGVSANVVLNGFKDKYVESDALQAKDVNELNLTSKSYMFDAKSSENEKGAYDVVLSRKSFNDLIENESVAKFLEDNYKKENNESFYYNLKKADDMHSFSKKVANNLGESILPNFRSENIILYRNLSRDFDEGLNGDEKYMGGYKYVDMSLDDDGNIEGGDVKANVAYGMIKNKKNKNLDYGVGVSIATIDGKYGDKGSRDSKSFGVWVPVKYKLDNGIDISSKLYLGYNDTKYERFGDFGKRKANFDEYQYGINAILSKDIDLVNDIKFNPLTEINLYGAYQKGFDEGSINNAIRVDDNNSIIAELGLGAYLKKDIVFDDNSKLGVKLGGIYYVEFFEDGKSFDIEMNGMGGKYSILHRKNMNRAVLTLRANYDYNDFSVYGGIEKEFGNNDALLIDVGAKYNF